MSQPLTHLDEHGAARMVDVTHKQPTVRHATARAVVELGPKVAGVEMEALTAASVAALAVVDMVKGIDKSVRIGGVELVSKSGGKSGDWVREG